MESHPIARMTASELQAYCISCAGDRARVGRGRHRRRTYVPSTRLAKVQRLKSIEYREPRHAARSCLRLRERKRRARGARAASELPRRTACFCHIIMFMRRASSRPGARVVGGSQRRSGIMAVLRRGHSVGLTRAGGAVLTQESVLRTRGLGLEARRTITREGAFYPSPLFVGPSMHA